MADAMVRAVGRVLRVAAGGWCILGVLVLFGVINADDDYKRLNGQLIAVACLVFFGWEFWHKGFLLLKILGRDLFLASVFIVVSVFGSLLVEAITGIYLNQVKFFYLLVVFGGFWLMERSSMQKPKAACEEQNHHP